MWSLIVSWLKDKEVLSDCFCVLSDMEGKIISRNSEKGKCAEVWALEKIKEGIK